MGVTLSLSHYSASPDALSFGLRLLLLTQSSPGLERAILSRKQQIPQLFTLWARAKAQLIEVRAHVCKTQTHFAAHAGVPLPAQLPKHVPRLRAVRPEVHNLWLRLSVKLHSCELAQQLPQRATGFWLCLRRWGMGGLNPALDGLPQFFAFMPDSAM